MRNLWLITKREYISRGKSSAYIISTLFLMVMLVVSTLAPALLASKEKTDPLNVLLLDKTGQVAAPLKAMAESGEAQSGSAELRLEIVQGDEEALMERARAEKVAVLIIEGTFPADLKARYYSRAISDLNRGGVVLNPLNAMVRSARMQQHGIDPSVVTHILRPLEVEQRQLKAQADAGEGRSAQDFMASMLLALGAVMAIYFVNIMNGNFIFQGVLEEKISRVMEVVAASVRPGQMMAGKVLGLGALGLTQFFLMGAAWYGGNALSKQVLSDAPTAQSIGLGIGLLVLLFMLLGYAINATMMAAAAATISRMEDSQTLMMPLTMLQVVPMMVIMPIMQEPNGVLARVFSFIPFFSPPVMVARVILGEVPVWELILSLLVLLAASVLMTWAGGRIYRAAMLSYGGRPTMKQLWGFLRAG